MLKEIEIFVALVFLLLAVLLIFNARLIVRKKLDASSENVKVNIIKWIGVFMAILSLVYIYYLH